MIDGTLYEERGQYVELPDWEGMYHVNETHHWIVGYNPVPLDEIIEDKDMIFLNGKAYIRSDSERVRYYGERLTYQIDSDNTTEFFTRVAYKGVRYKLNRILVSGDWTHWGQKYSVQRMLRTHFLNGMKSGIEDPLVAPNNVLFLNGASYVRMNDGKTDVCSSR